jgi:Putative beta-barrel porin-2, OmpL-like. bbp2
MRHFPPRPGGQRAEHGTATRRRRRGWVSLGGCLLLWCLAAPAAALEGTPAGQAPEPHTGEPSVPPAETKTAPATSDWHYGGFIDLGASIDFNFPDNHQFRSRSTTPRANELDLNMALVYARKDISAGSPWGLELAIQTGQDARAFAFATNDPTVDFADQLRQFGKANVSYLASIGKGLTLQAGLFSSLMGYESLYAKDNPNYSRAWIADFSPYLMFGVNASYPLSAHLTGTLFVIRRFFHLANENNLPSYGAQLAYTPSPPWTLKETLYYGPDEADTALEFWRAYSDTIVEWKRDRLTIALDHQIGTEQLVGPRRRTFFWGAALFTRWNVSGPWSIAVRPEFYWDRDGRMTGAEQFVKALTTTLEYKVPWPYAWTNVILRVEYRFDESTGVGGGFFKDGEVSPGVLKLTPQRHALTFAAIWTFDSP